MCVFFFFIFTVLLSYYFRVSSGWLVFCSWAQKLFPHIHITLTVPSGSVPIQENDEIRCASIHLMGNLSKFGSGEPVFKDQIHNVLVSLLLHLVDPNPQVVKVQWETCTHTHKCEKQLFPYYVQTLDLDGFCFCVWPGM